MTKDVDPNLERVPVPKSMAPLTGYVDVPIVVSPGAFDEFWTTHLEQMKLIRKEHPSVVNLHSTLRTYITRRPLVAHCALESNGKRVTLPPDPMKLVDLGAAAFVVAATQKPMLRVTNLPNLDAPLTVISATEETEKT